MHILQQGKDISVMSSLKTRILRQGKDISVMSSLKNAHFTSRNRNFGHVTHFQGLKIAKCTFYYLSLICTCCDAVPGAGDQHQGKNGRINYEKYEGNT